MKLIITGASGFIGRQLIPYLEKQCYFLLLVGRDIDKMSELFPNKNICDYDNLKAAGEGYDAVLHLAVINNNKNVDAQIFREVNVDLLEKVAKDAIAAKIPQFINLSSTHSQIANNNDHYSVTKRQGEAALKSVGLPLTSNYYLPAVYGEKFNGKLSFLNYVPKVFRPIVLGFVASLRSTLSIRKLAAAIHSQIEQGTSEVKYITRKYQKIYLTETQISNNIFLFQKRLFDLVFTITAILLLSWLFIITFLSVLLSSPGPPIFSQQRIGKNKREFTCYKFRTMAVGTPDQPTHLTSNAQLTKLGSFLRKTKLDELPQLFNILRNDMSLVGPRPCLPSQRELIDERSKRSVFEVKPGITGLAQTKAIDMSDPIKLAVEDATYVALQTLPGDMMLIAHTFLGKGQGDRIIG